MDVVFSNAREIILLGDFNIDANKSNKTWENIIESYNFQQLVKQTTRITKSSATLIDHIYTTCADNITECSVPINAMSDHYPVCCTWSKRGTKTPKHKHISIKYRNYKNFNRDVFLQDLVNSSLDYVYQLPDPDDALDHWLKTFLSIFDKHVPFKEVRVKRHTKPPWITQEVVELMRDRDRAHKNRDLTMYRSLRNKVQYVIRKEKKNYFKNIVIDKTNTKDIWKAINTLTNKHKSSQSLPSNQVTCDQFSRYFQSDINQLKAAIPDAPHDISLLSSFCENKCYGHISSNIPLMTTTEVFTHLRNLKNNNSSGLDGISSRILRHAAPAICESLTFIYNQCLPEVTSHQPLKSLKCILI